MAEHVPGPQPAGDHQGGTAFTVFDYLGLGFILEPPAVVVHAMMQSEPLTWPMALYGIPFLLIGSICIYIGRHWNNIKPKWNATLVRAIDVSSLNYVVLFGIIALTLTGIAVLPIFIWPPNARPRNDQQMMAPQVPSQGLAETPTDVLQLVKSLRTQLDSATDALSAKNREFEIVKRDLEMARHPPARSGPLSTASLSLAMGKGAPREIAADNVRWIAWDARARGSELRWSAPSSTSSPLGIYSLNQPTYPDLSLFTDGEYAFTKNGTSYRIFDVGAMSIVFMTFDKPVDTTSFQLSSESTLPKWKYWCKDNSVCAVWFDERPDNLSFTVRVGR
jgi:hypothetical protein